MSLTDILLNHGHRPSPERNQVRTFLESKESVEGLMRHLKRSPRQDVVEHVSLLQRFLNRVSKAPTEENLELLEGISKDCKDLLSLAHGGALPKSLSRYASRLEEACRTSGSYGPGLSRVTLEECQFEAEHKKFVKAFDKKHKVSHEKVEMVNDGLFIYYGLEDTEKLLKVPFIDLQMAAFEEEYLLLRSGTMDDITYGMFQEALSKWGFVRSPKEGSQPESE